MWRETVAQSTAPPSPCCTQGKWTFLCICYLLYTPPVSHCRPPAFISGISSTPPAFISGTLLYIFGGLFMYSLLPSSLLNFQINFSCAISYMLLCYSSIAISNSTFDLSHQTAVSCQLYKVSGRNVHTAHRQWLPWQEFDRCQTGDETFAKGSSIKTEWNTGSPCAMCMQALLHFYKSARGLVGYTVYMTVY